MTHMNNGGLPNHGYTHWWKMFNPLQLLVHSQILKAIMSSAVDSQAKECVLGGFQQYLRNQVMFTIWNPQRDTPEPMFSNSNYHPKATTIENSVFSKLGRGNWTACVEGVVEGAQWGQIPWEPVVTTMLEQVAPELASGVSGKSTKVELPDKVYGDHKVNCGSATDLTAIEAASFDAVITDPPFGGLLHYSELSDFFYVWLRLALKNDYPNLFEPEYVPKALEAVANRARQPDDPDAFYQRILTDCWREAYRVVKPGGILAFTFHHSEDEPWVSVLGKFVRRRILPRSHVSNTQ